MQVGGLLLSLLISACRLSHGACRQATAVIKVKGDEIACESVSLMLMKGVGGLFAFLESGSLGSDSDCHHVAFRLIAVEKEVDVVAVVVDHIGLGCLWAAKGRQ